MWKKKLICVVASLAMLFSQTAQAVISEPEIDSDGNIAMSVSKGDSESGARAVVAVYDSNGYLTGIGISELVAKDAVGEQTPIFKDKLNVSENSKVKGFFLRTNDDGSIKAIPMKSATPSVTPTTTPAADVTPSTTPTTTPTADVTPSATPTTTPAADVTPSVTPTVEPTATPTAAPTLSPLDDGAVSAFRYLSGTSINGFNTEGAAQALIGASEDGTTDTPLTMVSDEYTDDALGIVRNTPVLKPISAWGENPYVQVTFAAKGYTDISVSAKVGATKKGPASYKLQYSTDGETFTDAATFTATANKTLYSAFNKVALADTDECETVYIRIVPDGTTTINGGELSGASGEYAVNDILIYATASGQPTAEPIPVPSAKPLSKIVLSDECITLLDEDGTTLESAAEATVNGFVVTITAAGTYTIEGSVSDGQIGVAASSSDDEVIVNLNGVSVTNTTDDAFKATVGKVKLVPMNDTENTFSASADGACAVYGKHDITIKGEDGGNGKLTAISALGNGIRSKKDIEIGVCDLVVNAGKNGIKGDKSVTVTKKNKSVTVVANGDAIKSDLAPELDESGSAEGGTVTIKGGTINLTAKSSTDTETNTVSTGDGIQADTLVKITGGTISITASGEAIKANASSIEYLEDETQTEGTPAEGDGCVEISGGTLTLSADEDAIKAVKNVTIGDSADITITKSQEGIQVKEIIYTDDTETTVQAQVDGTICINGGKINITSSEDGIQCGTGNVTITDGDITVNSQLDGIQAEDTLNIGGGTIKVTAHGGANGSSTEDSCKGLKAGKLLYVSGGTIDVNSYDDALHSNHTARIKGGDITAQTSDDGVHADCYLYISDDAVINVTKSYEGIEAAEIYISGGSTYVVSSDDGANAAGEKPTDTAYDINTETVQTLSLFAGGMNGGPNWGQEDSSEYGYMEISGGLLYIEAEGDGFDSNGSALISGGTVLVNGPTSGGNGVFDIGDSSGSTLKFTGGTIVGAGIADMAVTPDSTTQYYVLYGGSSSGGMGGGMGGRPGSSSSSGSSSIQVGKAIQLTDSSGNVIMTYAPSKTTSWLLISTPDMPSGSYTLSYGGTVSGGTYTKDSYGIVTGGTYSGGSTTTLTATK